MDAFRRLRDRFRKQKQGSRIFASKSRSAYKVLGIPELLEMILLHLSMKDIFVALRVNTFFRDVINGSEQLKRAMLLEPGPKHDYSQRLPVPPLSPLVCEILRKHRRERSIECAVETVDLLGMQDVAVIVVCNDFEHLAARSFKLHRGWRKMKESPYDRPGSWMQTKLTTEQCSTAFYISLDYEGRYCYRNIKFPAQNGNIVSQILRCS